MADDWDEPSTQPSGDDSSRMGGFASDGGRSFSRGRGFTAVHAKPGLSVNDDDWGSSGTNSNQNRGGGRNFSDVNENGNSWNNGNGNNDGGSWGGGGDDSRPRRGGGRGRGGGGRGGGFRRENRSENGDSWGGGEGQEEGTDGGWGGDSGRRGRGGGRGRGGFRGGRGGRNEDRDGSKFDDESSSWGGGGGGDDGNDGGWGNTDNDNGNDFGGRGRGGRGRGRGGRGGRGGGNRGDGGGDGDADGESAEPRREIYIPPEPTTDESEIFSSGISSGLNFIKYDDIEVKVSGENVPNAVASFENAGLRTLILENIQKSHYNKPTPIQKHAIPIIMAGRDIMGCAQTGSGKTAAFLLPIIHCLLANPQDLITDGEHTEPQAIIVSPTRELAIQIYEEARKFAYGSAIKIVLTYGGTSVGYQRRHVTNGCHILVATPGRMNDFVRRGTITFSSTRFVVLDEADRMLDMGFLPNMEEMLGHETMVPTGQRQTLMFSATFPEEIQRLAAKFLNNYVFVTVGIVGGACQDVQQVLYQVDRVKKRNKLVEILRSEGTEKTLVFVETKRNADFLATYLSENDFQSTSIHGDRLQREREEALRDFKRGNRNILVATAVAARGLDIKNVKHVINYDLPKSIDEYVHRIGRTGRLGNSGKATSFFDESQDSALAPDLSRILKQAEQPVPDWLSHCGGGGSYSSSSFGGHDVRGADSFNRPQPVEVEEEGW